MSSVAPVAGVEGVDVSGHQRHDAIDWTRVYKDGRRFVFAKCTEGLWRDPSYARHTAKARDADLLVGSYHFARVNGSPTGQAQYFAEFMGDISLPPVLDIEGGSELGCLGYDPEKQVSALDRRVIVEWCELFVSKFESITKIRPVIYSYPGYLNALPLDGSMLLSRDLWVAHYGVRAPMKTAWSSWRCWQYAADPIPSGRVDGFDHNIDCNVFNGTESELGCWLDNSRVIDHTMAPNEWGPRTAEQVMPEVFR